MFKIFGGTGETRTHTPISEPTVFKTDAASPTRLTVPHFSSEGQDHIVRVALRAKLAVD